MKERDKKFVNKLKVELMVLYVLINSYKKYVVFLRAGGPKEHVILGKAAAPGGTLPAPPGSPGVNVIFKF